MPAFPTSPGPGDQPGLRPTLPPEARIATLQIAQRLEGFGTHEAPATAHQSAHPGSGVVAGPEGVSYGPSPDDQARALRREILDHAAAVEAAREAKAKDATLTEKVAGLRALRDARKGLKTAK